MAFNLGAFAGGLAKGGMDTYQTIEAINSQKKRDELIELQAQEAKLAMEERAALKEAAGVYNKVGGQDYAPELQRTAGIGAQQAQGLAVNTGAGGDDFDRAVNESTQGVLREAAGRQGAALPTDAAMKPAAYTRDQADAAYLAKVRGINPERALDVEGKQTQTAIGKSSLARIKADDDFSTWLQDSQALANKDPVGFLKANLGAYNNAKKGSYLDDGNTASVVSSADSKSFSFVRTDAKGKLVDSTPIDPNSAGKVLEHIAFSKYAALPGKFKESAELRFKGREVAAKEEDVKSSGEYRRAVGGKASQSQVQVMKEKITSLGAVYRRADPSLSVEAAEKKAAQELVRSPDARADAVTPDQINKFIELNPDLMQKKGKSGKMEPLSAMERVDAARTALTRGAGGGTAAVSQTDAAAAKASTGSADPFAKKTNAPPGTVDTENVPPLPSKAIPSSPVRYGNIDPVMQDHIQSGVTAVDQQIAAAEAALRSAPNLANAQNLQRLRAERDKLAANPLLR